MNATAAARDRSWVPFVLAVALAAVIALHLFEPDLDITWSHAHLSRRPWLPWLAALVAASLPFVVRAAWRHPLGGAPLTPWSARRVFALWIPVLFAAVGVALATEAPILAPDVKFLRERMGDDAIVGRWHLLVTGYRLLVSALSGVASTATVIRLANAVFGSIAIVAIVGSARCLATTRREAAAIAALALTSLGTAQLVTGYADIYPVPLALVALFCWLGLQTITGARHPAWAISVAAIGPFVYLGMVLTAPALVALVVVELRRPGGWKRLAIAATAAAGLVGAATLPGFGAPFALRAFFAASFDVPVVDLGYTEGGYQLPLERIFSWEHLNDVAHTMLLVDPVGWLLVLLPGLLVFVAGDGSPDRRKLAFLLPMLGAYLMFLVSMDSLYGAYLDWDLYSYGAIFTSLAGAYALVCFGRDSRWLGLLLGLALATASVHLLARLHAMDVDHDVHLEQSEPHLFKRLIEER